MWRLVLTALLLVVLAGSSITIFNNITSDPNTHVLPTVSYERSATVNSN